MSDEQEQLRQHWQELAEQLGLDTPRKTSSPPIPTPVAMNESVAPVSRNTDIEVRGSHIEDRESKVELQPEQENESAQEFSFSSPESEPPAEPSREAAEEDADFEEPIPNEPRGDRHGRTGSRSDRSERSSRSSRGSRFRRSDDEPSSPDDRDDKLAEREAREISDAEEEIEPAILHDSSSPGPEKEEDDDIDDVDTLSDWNVPSWTELIGSLYRPEK